MCVDRDGQGGKEEKSRKERRADYMSWCSQRAQWSVWLTMYSLFKNFFLWIFICYDPTKRISTALLFRFLCLHSKWIWVSNSGEYDIFWDVTHHSSKFTDVSEERFASIFGISIGSEDRGALGLVGKRACANELGLGEAMPWGGFELGPVPWPSADLSRCEGPLRPPLNGRLRTGTDSGNPTV
jgi:hypothetical protein